MRIPKTVDYLGNLDEVDELRHATPVLIPRHPVHLVHQQHTLLVHLHTNVLPTKYLQNINDSTINPPLSSLPAIPSTSSISTQQHTLLVHVHINVLATKYLQNINDSTINPPLSSLPAIPSTSSINSTRF
jgi:hypothetical protein